MIKTTEGNMKKGLKIAIIVVSSLLALILAALAAFLVLNNMGKLQFHKNDTNITNSIIEEDEEGIIYKGQFGCCIISFDRNW